MKSKIETYLGFCVRSGKIVYGADNVETQKRGVKLLIIDEAISPNSLKVIIKSQSRFACPLILAQEGVLGEYLHKPAVKAVAIKEENLASAILSVVDDDPQFKLYSGGTK